MRFSVLFYSEFETVSRSFEESLNELFQDTNIFLAKNHAETIELSRVLMFNIIVLDYGDKNFKNHTLLNELKKIQPFTKILIYSRRNEVTLTEVTLRNEFVDFFEKKKHSTKLEEAVLASLNYDIYNPVSH